MIDGFVIPPGLILIAAGLVLPFVTGYARGAVLLVAPLLALLTVWQLPDGSGLTLSYLGYELNPVKADALGRLFATVFCIMVFGGGLYSLNQGRMAELAAAYVYAGSAVSVTFCGDLISLFIFWEIMAIASTVVVFTGGSGARGAGLRYALIHFFGGVLLMAGIAGEITSTGSVAFTSMTPDSIPAGSFWPGS